MKISKLNNNLEPTESLDPPPDRPTISYIKPMTFKAELPFVRIWRRWPRRQWALQFGRHSQRWLGFGGDGGQIERRCILLDQWEIKKAVKQREGVLWNRERWESYLSIDADGVPPAAPNLCPCLPTPFISPIPTPIWTSGITLLTIIDPFFELSVIIPLFFVFFLLKL